MKNVEKASIEAPKRNGLSSTAKLRIILAILSSAALIPFITNSFGLASKVIDIIFVIPKNEKKAHPSVFAQTREQIIKNEKEYNQNSVFVSDDSQFEDTTGYKVSQDIVEYDMRGWRKPDSTKIKYSSVIMRNTLEFIKTKDIEEITLYFGTSGTGIENLRCVTHIDSLYFTIISKDNIYNKSYILRIDVSQEPINKPFSVVVEGMYWDAKQPCSIENYVDTGEIYKEDMNFIVYLPEQYKVQDYGAFLKSYDDSTFAQYTSPNGNLLYLRDKNILRWRIIKPKQGNLFKLSWTFADSK